MRESLTAQRRISQRCDPEHQFASDVAKSSQPIRSDLVARALERFHSGYYAAPQSAQRTARAVATAWFSH